jgi:octaprenyl-diphosphate synthase
MKIGMAFQLRDDVLDYGTPSADIGKNVGDDLAEGKPTLPLIHAIAHSAPAQAERLKQAIREGGLDALGDVLAAIRATGALELARERAHRYADSARDALAILPRSRARDALAVLADYAIDRTR